MTNYKVIIGEVILRDMETGHILNDGNPIPLSQSNIIVDKNDKAVADYLVKELGHSKYKLQKMDHSPIYLEYELN